jgi:MFS transporter, UMF1 family
MALNKKVIAWAFYDWANSAFATTVMVVFFPIFFKQYWSAGVEATQSTLWLGITSSTSSFVVAVLAPWLGALADQGNARLKFLALFTTLGVVGTAALSVIGKGEWPVAAIAFGIASLGFWGGIIFYDALLLEVAPRDRLHSVSGIGYAVGYLGGGVLLAVNVWMSLSPQTFGFTDATEAVRASFVSVAVWWTVFAIPIFVTLRDRNPRPPAHGLLKNSFAELARTFREVRRYRAAFLFLLAYWLYIDGVNTMQKMAVDYGLSLGFPSSSLVTAVLMIQFVGFPATLLFGWLGDRVTPFVGIAAGILIYAGVTCYAVSMTNVTQFYWLSGAIACVQGAIQALSRSYFARLIPVDRSAEFFGFYNMMGKFAAVLGPLLIGATAAATGNARLALLSLLLLFIGGGVMLVVAARAARTNWVAMPAT